jgi:hypothetical protein
VTGGPAPTDGDGVEEMGGHQDKGQRRQGLGAGSGRARRSGLTHCSARVPKSETALSGNVGRCRCVDAGAGVGASKQLDDELGRGHDESMRCERKCS